MQAYFVLWEWMKITEQRNSACLPPPPDTHNATHTHTHTRAHAHTHTHTETVPPVPCLPLNCPRCLAHVHVASPPVASALPPTARCGAAVPEASPTRARGGHCLHSPRLPSCLSRCLASVASKASPNPRGGGCVNGCRVQGEQKDGGAPDARAFAAGRRRAQSDRTILEGRCYLLPFPPSRPTALHSFSLPACPPAVLGSWPLLCLPGARTRLPTLLTLHSLRTGEQL